MQTVEKLYERDLKKEIMKYMDMKEALIVLGPRQAGKTSLLKLLIKEIRERKNVFYFDLEDPRDFEIVEGGIKNIIEYVSSKGASIKKKIFLFIDEIHYMKNPSKFIKLTVDHYSDKIKLICTGSSALKIKTKFHDSLVGRKLIFELYPLSFKEFLIFKNKKELAFLLPENAFGVSKDKTRFFEEELTFYFKEFLIFGGYPRVVLEDNYEKKEKLLGEIVGSYVLKDIRALFNIGDVIKFNNFVKLLSRETGGILNILELSKEMGISRQTVLNYISILENSFLINTLHAFSTNVRVEIRKAKKVYWIDTGIRNYIAGDLSFTFSRSDIGVLLENCVFSGLLKRKKEIDEIFYWRTKDKAEVDFIYKRGKNLIPIEIKTRGKFHRGIKNFMKKYGIKKGFIAHLGKFIKNDLNFIPVYWLC